MGFSVRTTFDTGCSGVEQQFPAGFRRFSGGRHIIEKQRLSSDDQIGAFHPDRSKMLLDAARRLSPAYRSPYDERGAQSRRYGGFTASSRASS
jgi:hypothetical protein